MAGKKDSGGKEIIYPGLTAAHRYARGTFFFFFSRTSGLLRWATYRVYRSMVVAVQSYMGAGIAQWWSAGPVIEYMR